MDWTLIITIVRLRITGIKNLLLLHKEIFIIIRNNNFLKFKIKIRIITKKSKRTQTNRNFQRVKDLKEKPFMLVTNRKKNIILIPIKIT